MEAYYSHIADFILHFDRYLPVVMEAYGHWIYAFLFIIVFCETGLVVTPFLPGDSLLFACGALAATADGLSLPLLAVIFWLQPSAAMHPTMKSASTSGTGCLKRTRGSSNPNT